MEKAKTGTAQATSEIDIGMIDAFAFEGGGVRAIAHIGGVLEFPNVGEIHKFSGTSAGSLIAGAMAAGYTPAELAAVMTGVDMTTWAAQSGPLGPLKVAWRIVKNWGEYTGDPLLAWIQGILAAKGLASGVTFEGMYRATGNELVVVASNLASGLPVYFRRETFPDVSVALAMRASCSIPGIFVPVHLDGMVLVDGGLLNNYPLWVFDCPPGQEARVSDEVAATSRTLGFRLTGSAAPPVIDGPLAYVEAMADAVFGALDRAQVHQTYWARSVTIDTGNVRTTDWAVLLAKRDALLQAGREAMIAFIAQQKAL